MVAQVGRGDVEGVGEVFAVANEEATMPVSNL